MSNRINGTTGNDSFAAMSVGDPAYAFYGYAIYVLAGNDTVTGSLGGDLIYGDLGADRLYGFDGNDNLYGDGGNDYLAGESGDDDLSGASGVDRLYGGDGSDDLFGGADNDTMDGGTGEDDLSGNTGADVLTGGPDGDRFYYNSLHDSNLASGRDLITDLDPSEGDLINISGIDAKTSAAGNNSFNVWGGYSTTFSGQQGELHYYHNSTGRTVIEADTNGDKKADLQIFLSYALILAHDDFIF